MSCHLFGAKQLSKPMLASHQSHPKQHISVKKIIKSFQNWSIFIDVNNMEFSGILSRGEINQSFVLAPNIWYYLIVLILFLW